MLGSDIGELVDQFNHLIKSQYHIPEVEDLEKMNFRERNQQLYDVLKHYRICVVPSQKIESFDHLPHFQIIESSLRDIKRMPNDKGRKGDGKNGSPGGGKAKLTEKNKLTRFDPRNVKGNIELFQHINEI